MDEDVREIKLIAGELIEVLCKVLQRHRASKPVGYSALSMVLVTMMMSEGKTKDDTLRIIGEVFDLLRPQWAEFKEGQRAGHA